MSYTPTNWQTGDTITAEKLNKMESGIENASGGGGDDAFVVTATVKLKMDGTIDTVAFSQTEADTLAAIESGKNIGFNVVVFDGTNHFSKNVPGCYLGISNGLNPTFSAISSPDNDFPFYALIQAGMWEWSEIYQFLNFSAYLNYEDGDFPIYKTIIFDSGDGRPEWQPVENFVLLDSSLVSLITYAVAGSTTLATQLPDDGTIFSIASRVRNNFQNGRGSIFEVPDSYASFMLRVTGVFVYNKENIEKITIVSEGTAGVTYTESDGTLSTIDTENVKTSIYCEYDNQNETYKCFVAATGKTESATIV